MVHRSLFRTVGTADSFEVLGSDATVLARGEETDGTYELFVGDFPGGFVLPPHRHPWAEWYFVLDGTLHVTVGRHTEALTTGGFATIPPRAVHALATGDHTARVLLWTAGGDALAMFDEMAEHLPAGPPTEELLPQIAELTAKYGLELVLPQPA